MTHPYPHRCSSFDYRGRYRYALNFTTLERRRVFVDAASVNLVWTQIVRAGTEKGFEVIVYCFMPDHLHLVVEGLSDIADCKAFIKSAKQYSEYYYRRANGRIRLWQRYGHDRIIRDDAELVEHVRYVVANPVKAGLALEPQQYPFLGSQRWTVAELLDWCKRPREIVRK
jgi:putative transposase